MKWVILIISAMGFNFASDVYFRAMGHNAGGVEPHSWDLSTTLLVGVGIFGLAWELFMGGEE